jgi:hypothetical protein
MTNAFASRWLRLLGAASVCVASFAPTLRAEPIAVTSGQIALLFDDPTSFALFASDGFALTGGFGFAFFPVSPQRTCFLGCAPGMAVDMSAFAGGDVAGNPFPLGFLTRAEVGGQIFGTGSVDRDSPRLAGTLRLDAPSVVLPPLKDGVFGVSFTTPFTFHGDVTAFAADDPDARAPLFHVDLFGQGTATLALDNDAVSFTQPEVTYQFAATPEPTTLLLFAVGMIGVAARARKLTRRHVNDGSCHGRSSG